MIRGNQSVLNPHGPVAARLAEMSWTWIIFYGAVFLITIAVLCFALWRARSGALLSSSASSRLVLIGGLIVPVMALAGTLVYSVVVGNLLAARPYAERGALVVHVEGKQWWWNFQYMNGGQLVATSPNELHIPVGQPVVFQLRSSNVIHSFWVPSLTGKMDLIPGRANELWLQADHPGIYRGQCAEFCGMQHAHMGFEVIAEAPEEFGRWLDGQKQPAAEPAGDKAQRGQQVFLDGPCALCHAIRGTQALATVGPDLTHLASRRTIAAATLPRNPGSLGGWIVDAQGIKPGCYMPRINMPAQDLEDLIEYLETLR